LLGPTVSIAHVELAVAANDAGSALRVSAFASEAPAGNLLDQGLDAFGALEEEAATDQVHPVAQRLSDEFARLNCPFDQRTRFPSDGIAFCAAALLKRAEALPLCGAELAPTRFEASIDTAETAAKPGGGVLEQSVVVAAGAALVGPDCMGIREERLSEERLPRLREQ
jgi:hypothetical protein